MMPNTLDPHCLKLVLAKVVKKDFLRKKRKGGKLDPKWVGPYIITAKFSKRFYSLQSIANSSDCIKRVNGAHLTMFYKIPTSLTLYLCDTYVTCGLKINAAIALYTHTH